VYPGRQAVDVAQPHRIVGWAPNPIVQLEGSLDDLDAAGEGSHRRKIMGRVSVVILVEHPVHAVLADGSIHDPRRDEVPVTDPLPSVARASDTPEAYLRVARQSGTGWSQDDLRCHLVAHVERFAAARELLLIDDHGPLH
jgi:hypothetical protein